MKSKLMVACFFLCVVFTFSGCDALYRMLDKEGAEEKELVGEVIPFESNPTVEEIQGLLKLYGYNPGKIDGMLGLRTRDAIEKFQKDNGLTQTRFVDDETWALMKKPRDVGLVKDTSVDIYNIQYVLNQLGYSPGKLDGKPGKKTTAAVKEFQKQEGLKVDGKIGFQTLSAMLKYVEMEEK